MVTLIGAQWPCRRHRRRGRKGGDVARVADDVRPLSPSIWNEGSAGSAATLELERRREDSRTGSEHRSAPQVVLRYPFAHGEAARRIGRYLEGRFDVVVGRPVILLPGAASITASCRCASDSMLTPISRRFRSARRACRSARWPVTERSRTAAPARWRDGRGRERRPSRTRSTARGATERSWSAVLHAASVSTTVPTFANSTGSQPR